jgi:nicotinamide-nucleotide amidase
MRVGILTVGSELTTGRIQDTNTAYLAGELASRTYEVSASMAVGDSQDAIRRALDFLLPISNAVIVTGGLGPTADDITTECIAKAFGLKLYLDEKALQVIKDRFERFKIRWSDNNAKQATFPKGAQPIPNPVGTAWGYALKRNRKMIIVIPGVPREVRKIFPEGVLPIMEKASGLKKTVVLTKTIKLFGLAEALVDDALANVGYDRKILSIGFYPRFPENHIVLTARDTDKKRAQKNLDEIRQKIEERLGKHIFGYDDDTLEGIVGALLTERKLTLAVAESLTGGLIMDRVTNVPGSSRYFERGVVSYSNNSKMDLLNVPEQTLEEFGSVSNTTAILMAEGVRRMAKTDIGLSTTGIAGPTGGTERKPVGTVFVAVTDGRRRVCRDFQFRWDRRRIKEITSQWALEMLRRFILGLE